MKHLLIIFSLLLTSVSWSKDEKENIYLVCDGTIEYKDNTIYKETKSYHLKLNKYSKYNIYYDLNFEVDCEHTKTFFVCESSEVRQSIKKDITIEIDRISGSISHLQYRTYLKTDDRNNFIEENNFVFKGKCEEKEEKLF